MNFDKIEYRYSSNAPVNVNPRPPNPGAMRGLAGYSAQNHSSVSGALAVFGHHPEI